MKHLLLAGAACLPLLLGGGTVAAAPLDGSAAFFLTGVTGAPTPIAAGTVFGFGGGGVSSTTGDFNLVPVLTAFTALSGVTASPGSAFSFTLGGYGSFAGTVQAPINVVGPPTARDVDFTILGTFTPGALLPGFTPGAASLTFAATETGGAGAAISASFTAVSTPIPAPGALALLGVGLLGLGALSRPWRARAA